MVEQREVEAEVVGPSSDGLLEERRGEGLVGGPSQKGEEEEGDGLLLEADGGSQEIARLAQEGQVGAQLAVSA